MKERKHIYYKDPVTGETKDAISATIPNESWNLSTLKKAELFLASRFDDAPCSAEVIQEMLSLLIEKFRNDPEQIERAIVQHFTKKKK